MSKLYALSKVIKKMTGWQVNSIFLGLNIFFWGIATLLIGSAGCYLYAHTLVGYKAYLICIAGGAATAVGFFGGALFLYRQNE